MNVACGTIRRQQVARIDFEYRESRSDERTKKRGLLEPESYD